MNNEKLLEQTQTAVDKISMEDKILLAEEERDGGLEPWEIAEITQHVLSKLPESIKNSEEVDLLFDIIYDAIYEALDKVQEL